MAEIPVDTRPIFYPDKDASEGGVLGFELLNDVIQQHPNEALGVFTGRTVPLDFIEAGSMYTDGDEPSALALRGLAALFENRTDGDVTYDQDTETAIARGHGRGIPPDRLRVLRVKIFAERLGHYTLQNLTASERHQNAA